MLIWDLLVQYKNDALSYEESVSLFFKIFPESRLKSFFEVEDRYSRKKLREALETEYDKLALQAQENSFKSFTPSKFANKPINLQLLPAELRAEYGKLGPLIREISSLHARLAYCPDDLTRYGIAEQIIKLSASRRMIFTRIDAFMETGKDPFIQTPSPVITQPVINPAAPLKKNFEVEYQLKLKRSQRTKLKGNPRRLEEYNKICKEIHELEQNRYVS